MFLKQILMFLKQISMLLKRMLMLLKPILMPLKPIIQTKYVSKFVLMFMKFRCELGLLKIDIPIRFVDFSFGDMSI